MHYNGVNSYILINDVKIYKFNVKYSEINAAPLCLSNFSKDFSLGNMKRLDYKDVSMTSVNCDSIGVDNTSDIQKYLMRKTLLDY